MRLPNQVTFPSEAAVSSWGQLSHSQPAAKPAVLGYLVTPLIAYLLLKRRLSSWFFVSPTPHDTARPPIGTRGGRIRDGPKLWRSKRSRGGGS